MSRGIAKEHWDTVHGIAIDVVNATLIEDDILYRSHTERMLAYLDDLLRIYPNHPSVLATVGDYLWDSDERIRQYRKALRVAEEQGMESEFAEIQDSIAEVEAERKC